jgi:alpha-galactosidase
MNRRNFIKSTGLTIAAALINDSLVASSDKQNGQLINLPDEVSASINDQIVKLKGTGGETWTYQNVIVRLENNKTSIAIIVQAPGVKISSVTLRWKISSKSASWILNDQWERTYGDASWHKISKSEILPWYFIEYDDKDTTGFGVKTGAKSFCFWQVAEDSLSLTLDLRSGGTGVQLSGRQLKAAEIVTLKSNFDESPFKLARRFTKLMCDKARMPNQPVYGINDWYFSYGNNSEKLILDHTQMMISLADGIANRPFSVIDAGWFKNPPSMQWDCGWGDDMSTPNEKFPDMGQLAEKIRKIGMRPGIWTRPLCGSYKDPNSLLLPLIKGRKENNPILDPSIPENLERVKSYFKLYNQWSYELVKFDYTSFDIFGKWGFEMLKDGSMSQTNWSMYDKSKTNAEIVLNLYQAIREAAGETYIISCNTFSHLVAGLFELNRIGDDTSGNEWDRTRKMGVNTLAFRGIHQGTFYAADPDCVGLTSKVPWEKNRQWMELVAKSGTPLFISAQPEATGTEQKSMIEECFKMASQNLPVGEPLDWMQTAFPEKWKLNGKTETFNWS